MTDTAKQYPLSDAEMLTATGAALQCDLDARDGHDWQAYTAQRDAIVRAATAKARTEYEAKLATARTAALRISSLAIVSPQASSDDVKVLLECLSAILELAPAPREEAVTVDHAERVARAVSGYVAGVAHRIALNPLARDVPQDELDAYKAMQEALRDALAAARTPKETTR